MEGCEDGFDIEDDDEDDLSPPLRPVGSVCLLQGPEGQGVHGVELPWSLWMVSKYAGTVNLTSSRLGR
jgi:hypothetical protein